MPATPTTIPTTTRRATRRGSRTRRPRLPERDPSKHNLDHFQRFCYTLKLPDGGGPFRLEEFQLAKLEDYFNGILESLWLEPTGAGKSTLLGAVALHHGTYVRASPNVFVLGGLGGHGRNTLDAAAGFIDRSEDLSRWWVAQEYGMGRIKSLIDAKGQIVVSSAGRRVGGRGGSSQEGKDPTLILVEEDHRHEDNGAAVATLISKIQKRSFSGPQVQIIHATTAGDTRDSPLGRLVDRATDSENGCRVETKRRPKEYYRRGVDPDGDLVMHEWAVPDHILPPAKHASRQEITAYLKHVKRACPAPMVTMRSLRLTYKANSAEPWVFQRQNANQWVTQDQAALDKVGWYAGDRGPLWVRNRRASGDKTARVLEIPKGAKGVFVGLDTAPKWDTTAIVPVWKDPKTGRPRTAGTVILKSEKPGAQRRMRDAIDVLEVMRERWPTMAVVFDRNWGGGLIAEGFEEDHGLTVIDHGQGVEFELASMLLGELIDQRGLEHDGNPELTEHVLAAVARRSRYGRRWRLDKGRDGRPIDGAAALAMAVNMVFNPPEDARRPFDPRDYRIEAL